MIKKEQRVEHLEYILHNLEKFCIENDIRLGQAIYIITHDKNIDLFSIENDTLNDLFLEDLTNNQYC